MSTSMLDVVLIVKPNFRPDTGYHISMLVGFYLMGNNQAFREIMLQQYTVKYYMSILCTIGHSVRLDSQKKSGVE